MPSQILDLSEGATKSFPNTQNHTHTDSYPNTEQSFLKTKFLMLLLTVASFSSQPIRVLLNVVPNLDCFQNSLICINYMILITNFTSLPSYPKRIGCLFFPLTPRWCCMKIGNWNKLKIEKTHNRTTHETRTRTGSGRGGLRSNHSTWDPRRNPNLYEELKAPPVPMHGTANIYGGHAHGNVECHYRHPGRRGPSLFGGYCLI